MTRLITVLLAASTDATRLHRVRPSDESLTAFAASIADRAINHDIHLARAPASGTPARSLRVIAMRVPLGHGRACWRRARRRLLSWEMHEGSTWSAVLVEDPPGRSLVTLAALPSPRLPLLWVSNPCRAVRRRVGRRRCSVGYSTLSGHLLEGEEKMDVVWSRDTDEVAFEVVSHSRGAGPLGKLLFPALSSTQRRFFREQCRCMQRAAAGVQRVEPVWSSPRSAHPGHRLEAVAGVTR